MVSTNYVTSATLLRAILKSTYPGLKSDNYCHVSVHLSTKLLKKRSKGGRRRMGENRLSDNLGSRGRLCINIDLCLWSRNLWDMRHYGRLCNILRSWRGHRNKIVSSDSRIFRGNDRSNPFSNVSVPNLFNAIVTWCTTGWLALLLLNSAHTAARKCQRFLARTVSNVTHELLAVRGGAVLLGSHEFLENTIFFFREFFS